MTEEQQIQEAKNLYDQIVWSREKLQGLKKAVDELEEDWNKKVEELIKKGYSWSDGEFFKVR